MNEGGVGKFGQWCAWEQIWRKVEGSARTSLLPFVSEATDHSNGFEYSGKALKL